MDARIKNKIIAEITATTGKTIKQTVRKSLKRALPEDFVKKTTYDTKQSNESKVQWFQNLEIKEIKSDTKEIIASWKKSTKQ